MSMAAESPQSSQQAPAGSPDVLRLYLRSIGRDPRQAPEIVLDQVRELRRLEAEAQGASPNALLARRAARLLEQRIVRDHLGLVVSCAFRWRHPGVPLLDLIQEGNIGLLRAVERFDPERGVRFPSYAVWWIRQGIFRGVENQARTVRLPSRVCEGIAKRNRVLHTLRAKLARDPDSAELAAALGISGGALERLEGAELATRPVEGSASDERAPLVERLADTAQPAPDDPVRRRWAARCLKRALSHVIPRDRRVLELRFGLRGGAPLSQREVGRRLGLSGERVRQIEKASFGTLRRALEGTAPSDPGTTGEIRSTMV